MWVRQQNQPITLTFRSDTFEISPSNASPQECTAHRPPERFVFYLPNNRPPAFLLRVHVTSEHHGGDLVGGEVVRVLSTLHRVGDGDHDIVRADTTGSVSGNNTSWRRSSRSSTATAPPTSNTPSTMSCHLAPGRRSGATSTARSRSSWSMLPTPSGNRGTPQRLDPSGPEKSNCSKGNQPVRHAENTGGAASAHHTILLQVIPFSAGAHSGMPGSFIVLKFSTDAPDVIHIDSMAGGLFLEKEADIQRYNHICEHLRAVALSPNDSVSRIASLRGDH